MIGITSTGFASTSNLVSTTVGESASTNSPPVAVAGMAYLLPSLVAAVNMVICFSKSVSRRNEKIFSLTKLSYPVDNNNYYIILLLYMSVVNLIRRQVHRTTTMVVVTSSRRAAPSNKVAGMVLARRSFSAQPSTPAAADEYDVDNAPLIPGIGRGKTSTGLVRVR